MTRQRAGPASRSHAWMLLGVLVASVLITSFTRHWIASVPFHDHLVLGPLTGDWVHHSHGQTASKRSQALQWVVIPGATTERIRVISFAADNAVQSFELSTFSLQSLVATVIAVVAANEPQRILSHALPCPQGLCLAPLVPPPRFR